jgi:hypothetical protein
MAEKIKKISTLIESQLPGFISSEYEQFSKFVEKYYEQLESTGNPLDIIQNIENYRDINFYEKNLLNQKTILSGNILANSSSITVADASSFPKENGYIRIGNEICFYKERTNNQFLEVSRGVSGNNTLGDLYNSSEFVTTQSSPHYTGDEVYNISNLFLYAFIKNFEEEYLGAFPEKYLKGEVDKRTLIKNINKFYKAKGTDRSIKFIFNSIVSQNESEVVEVYNPKDFTLKASVSDWVTKYALKVKVLSGDPLKLIGNVITQSLDDYDKTISFASAVVDNVAYLGKFDNENLYEIVLAPNTINGNFKIAARTTLRSNVSISADTGDRINLFSTMGFPKQGKVLVGNEVISFNDKNVNQLIIDDRQNPVSHTEGISVYSFSTVTGSHEEGTVRLLTLGVLYNLLPEKALPYSETGDLIQVSESGFETRDPVIFDVRKNATRWFVNTNFTKVNSIVPGVNSQINDLIADVSAIYEDDQYYYIAASSFPSHNNLLTLEITESLSDQKLLKLIRKYPTTTTEVYETGTRDVGILVDGSPVFGCKDFDFVTFGKIQNIKIESKGVGYAAPPTVLLNEQPGKAISVLSGETVNSITVISEDTYSSDPVIRITSGEGAILSPVVTEGRISSINVVNSGRYYSSPPTIRIIDQLGKGNFAEYEAILDNEGKIASCRRITGGRFYTSGNVIITVEARGKGAQATAKIKRWVKNRYEKLKNNLDANNSYVFSSFDGSKNYGYGVVANPVILRRRLGDSISAIYQQTTPLQHSSIIGYAYDGNPIYGPYGYSDPVNSSSSITRLSSGYSLNGSRPNGPLISQYPLGTFVDDYTWTPSVNSGKTELDSNNGRFCVTPDYPNGIYAYFITINQSNTPVFPYVLGNNFYSLPVDSNYNSIISQDDIPVSARRLKTEDYEINGNDFYGYIQDVKGGNISSATVYESLENFSVNSFVSINDFLTEGAGAAAVVSSVKGKEILSIESNQTKAIQFTTVENSYLFAGDTITQEVTGATGVLIGNSVNENNFVLSNVQGEFNTQNVINSETKVLTLILDSNSIFTQGATITLTDGEGNIGSDIATGEILEGITRQNSLKVKVISGEFILNNNYFLKSTNLGDTSRTQILNITSLSENLNIFDINDNIAIVETNGFHNIAVGDKVNVDILPDDTETETLYFVRKRLYQEAILNPVNHSSVIVDTGIGSADILNTGADYQSGVYENVELIFQDTSKARTDIGRPDDLNNAKATITVSNPAGLGYGGIASIVITNKGSNYKINDVLTVNDSSLNRLAGSTNIQRLYIAVNHIGFAEQNTTIKLSNVRNLSVDDYLKLNEEIVKITSVNVQQKTVVVLRGQKNTRPKNHYDKLKVELFEGNYKFTPNFGPFGEGIAKPLIVDYDSDNKKIFVSFNYGAQSPQKILLSSSFFDASTPAKLVTIKTTEDPKFKLEFSKDTENNLITNPIINIQKYYKYKFDTSHISMVDTYLDFSSSSNYNIFTEEKFVSSISPGNAGSFVNIKLGFGSNISSNNFQTKQRINFSNYFYFIKVSPNVDTDNSFLKIIDDPLTGEKVVTYTTDTKFVYELNSVPEYDGSGQMLYTTTSQFAIGKINSLAITNSGNDYKRLPIVEGVLPTASKECIVDPVYDTVNKNIAGFKILNQGSNYSKPKVVITDGDGVNYEFDCFVFQGKVTNVTVINPGINFTYKPTVKIVESDVKIYLNSNTIGIPQNVKIVSNGALFNSDKSTLSQYKSITTFILKDFGSTIFFPGEIITQPSTGAKARVAKNGWKIGNNLLKVDKIQGVFQLDSTIIGKGSNRVATIVDEISTIFSPSIKSFYDNLGFYSSDKGKIGVNSQKLTDSYFYQDYSYVIKSKTSIDVWRDLIKETTHPAGFELFGEVLVESDGNTSMPSEIENNKIESTTFINLGTKTISVIDTKTYVTESFIALNSLNIQRGLGSISVDEFDASETLAGDFVLSTPFTGRLDTYDGQPVGNTVFTIIDKKSGLPLVVYNEQQLIITIDGVLQEPGKAFKINGSQITFDSPPFGNSLIEGQEIEGQKLYGRYIKFKNNSLNEKYLRKLKSIENEFDGIKTTFNLYYDNGDIVKTDINENLIVALNAVIQKADTSTNGILNNKNSYYILRSTISSIPDKIVFSDPPIKHNDIEEGTEPELSGYERFFSYTVGSYIRLKINNDLIPFRKTGPFLIIDEIENSVAKIDNSKYALVFIDGVLQVEGESYDINGPTITFTKPLNYFISENNEVTYSDVNIIRLYGRDLAQSLTVYDFERDTFYNKLKLTIVGQNTYTQFINWHRVVNSKEIVVYQNNAVLGKLRGFAGNSINSWSIVLTSQNVNYDSTLPLNFSSLDKYINYPDLTITGQYEVFLSYEKDEDENRILSKSINRHLYGTELTNKTWYEQSKCYANLHLGDLIKIDGENSYREILSIPDTAKTKDYRTSSFISNDIYSKVTTTNYNGLVYGEGLSIVAKISSGKVVSLDWNKRELNLYLTNNLLLQPTAYQYFTPPIIQFIPNDGTGGGAKAEVIVYDGQVIDLILLDGGSEYQQVPTVVVAKGYDIIRDPNRKIDSIILVGFQPSYMVAFAPLFSSPTGGPGGIEIGLFPPGPEPIFIFSSIPLGEKEIQKDITTIVTPIPTIFTSNQIRFDTQIVIIPPTVFVPLSPINTYRQIISVVDAKADVISSSAIQSISKEITIIPPTSIVNNSIIEVPNEATNDIGAFLDAPLSVTDTIVYIADTGRFPSASRLLIGKEIVTYGKKLTDRFLDVIRGTFGTTATTHEAGDYLRHLPELISIVPVGPITIITTEIKITEVHKTDFTLTSQKQINVDNSEINLINEIIIIPPTSYVTSLSSYSSTQIVTNVGNNLEIISHSPLIQNKIETTLTTTINVITFVKNKLTTNSRTLTEEADIIKFKIVETGFVNYFEELEDVTFKNKYNLGSAGFNLKTFENNAFIDTGSFDINGTLESIDLAYPFLTIENFEIRPSSSITLNGDIFNLGIPTINSTGTFITSNVTQSQTIIFVQSTERFPANGKLLIGKEIVSYTGKTQNSFIGVIRGFDNTIAESHISGDYLKTFD